MRYLQEIISKIYILLNIFEIQSSILVYSCISTQHFIFNEILFESSMFLDLYIFKKSFEHNKENALRIHKFLLVLNSDSKSVFRFSKDLEYCFRKSKLNFLCMFAIKKQESTSFSVYIEFQ